MKRAVCFILTLLLSLALLPAAPAAASDSEPALYLVTGPGEMADVAALPPLVGFDGGDTAVFALEGLPEGGEEPVLLLDGIPVSGTAPCRWAVPLAELSRGFHVLEARVPGGESLYCVTVEGRIVKTPGVWALEELSDAYMMGFVPAGLEDRFGEPVTRGEFAALAVGFYELYMGSPIEGRAAFTDTDDECVEKLGYMGVIEGPGDGTYRPEESIERQAAAKIVAALAVTLGNTLPPAEAHYSDSDLIAPWARDAVGRLRNLNIMSGVGGDIPFVTDGVFDPRGMITVEQSIVVLRRLQRFYLDA